ncbi:hypothetical protein V3481_002167 [Fusarium oxysporum f. sp. vasinfectum]
MESHMSSWPLKGRRQRPRIVFSCLPCHSRKIKCDRHRLCRRCISAGRAVECQHQTQQLSPASADGASAQYSSLALFVGGKPRLGTATSWMTLMWEFKEIRPLLFGTDPDYKDIFHRIRRLKDLYPPAKAREFPFGAPGVMPESRTKLVSQLPDRCVAETFLGSYMEAFETMFPLWHESSYVDEMAQFWANPESADWTFFAQVYIMLALGCYATPKAKLQALGLDGHALSKLYLDHASVAFSGSQLTASFNYAGLRTLCMSMLARLMDLIASNDQRDCAITVGLTVRAAQTMNLHRHPRLFGGMPGAEMSTRIKIWTTLVLLDLLASVRSSLPPVIHSGDYDASVRLGRETDNDTLSPAPTDHDSDETPFDHILADFLPTASHIVRMANSVNQELDYTNVEKLDRQLRETLGKVSNLHDSTATPRKHRLRSEMFQIIIRRVMLILHEPFGRRPNAAVNFRCSYMRLLECSLALAVSQGALHSQNNPADGMKWALNMFKEDFETTLVCIALGIRGNKFDSEASTVNGTTPRDIAWSTLRRAVEITQEQAGDSIKHHLIFLGVYVLVAALECLECNGPIRERMFEAGEKFVSTMEKAKGQRLNDTPTAPVSDLPSAPGSEICSNTGPESNQGDTSAYYIDMGDLNTSVFF